MDEVPGAQASSMSKIFFLKFLYVHFFSWIDEFVGFYKVYIFEMRNKELIHERPSQLRTQLKQSPSSTRAFMINEL